MTQPAPAPYDTANQLFGETPSQLSTALVELPAGQRLALTIRTASTTLTVLLSAADAKVWAATVSQGAGSMSSSGLIVAAPGANGHAVG